MVKIIIFLLMSFNFLQPQDLKKKDALDTKIQNYLENKKGSWSDFNVPFEDGRALEKIILKNQYKNILEIGTSSGHSTIWLAKAASQTGGKVITIEIDKGRFEKAKKNFEDAGVSHLIEMHLGDAMLIIPSIKTNFDFVFSDATWSTQPADGYTKFFKLCEPKLRIGGMFTMHNVTDGYGDDGRLMKYIEILENYEMHIITVSNHGILVSKKLKERE
ncbi:MAG TPA: class I SAM-dependent methyltransferase [Leptospiraceae bacterium]|nr:class I SAM-dependent methyltransferase [Leptospiraceae bacterium]HMW08017.1 class I SAM-dependent methyltransferase [Leptospiraceae bacterium]HMZ64865.1 class I SAM-dependent methyltransferase [Leptospiraceae bacterium]HNC00673.1 class I SAM-dependent methyltransferase [Leptospiraceae bacterium]HNE10998.1 class I SAM-dependent methyltransferase [Leptospiraceae bacterium]